MDGFVAFALSLSSVPSTSFQVLHQLVPWVSQPYQGRCSKAFEYLYFCALEDL